MIHQSIKNGVQQNENSMHLESSDENHIVKPSQNLSSESIKSLKNESLLGASVQTVKNTKYIAFESKIGFVKGSLLLVLMICCNSLVIPLTLQLKAKSAIMNSAWRMQGTTLITFFINLFIKVFKIANNDPFKDIYDNAGKFIMAAIFATIWSMCGILGGSMTVTSHAVLLYNAMSIYIMLFSMIL